MIKRISSGLIGFILGLSAAIGVIAYAAQMEVAENTYPITLNGDAVSLEGYNINGNTYFKLRDIGDAIGFKVDFADNTIVLTNDARPGGKGEMQTLEEYTAEVEARVESGEISEEEAAELIAKYPQRDERKEPPKDGEIPTEAQ